MRNIFHILLSKPYAQFSFLHYANVRISSNNSNENILKVVSRFINNISISTINLIAKLFGNIILPHLLERNSQLCTLPILSYVHILCENCYWYCICTFALFERILNQNQKVRKTEKAQQSNANLIYFHYFNQRNEKAFLIRARISFKYTVWVSIYKHGVNTKRFLQPNDFMISLMTKITTR